MGSRPRWRGPCRLQQPPRPPRRQSPRTSAAVRSLHQRHQPTNPARYRFLDSRSHDFYGDWALVAKDVVSALRIEAGRNPYDRRLSDLIGELSTRSEDFRTWWASHDVRLHRTSTKQLHHSVVAGALELTGEALDLPGDAGLTIITYTVEPAAPSAQALQFLANWASQDPIASPLEST